MESPQPCALHGRTQSQGFQRAEPRHGTRRRYSHASPISGVVLELTVGINEHGKNVKAYEHIVTAFCVDAIALLSALSRLKTPMSFPVPLNPKRGNAGQILNIRNRP